MASRKFFSSFSSSPRCSSSAGVAPVAGGSTRCCGGGPTSNCSGLCACNGRTKRTAKRTNRKLTRIQESISHPRPNLRNFRVSLYFGALCYASCKFETTTPGAPNQHLPHQIVSHKHLSDQVY